MKMKKKSSGEVNEHGIRREAVLVEEMKIHYDKQRITSKIEDSKSDIRIYSIGQICFAFGIILCGCGMNLLKFMLAVLLGWMFYIFANIRVKMVRN